MAPSLAAAAAVCVAGVAGSCTSSEPAVRPGPPPRQLCPPGAVESMRKEFGINAWPRGFDRMVDVFAMPGYDLPPSEVSYTDSVPITEGRHEVRHISYRGPPRGNPPIGLPKRSVLVGDFFLRDRLYARFDEVRLPDGRRLPFCAELINAHPPFDVGVPFEPGSKPGAMRVRALVYVGSSDFDH